jgi:hypothetical protein
MSRGMRWKQSPHRKKARILSRSSFPQPISFDPVLFSLLPYFEYKKESLCGLCFVCLNSPCQLINAWTNLNEIWCIYHGTWVYLNGVFHKSLISVCVSVLLFLLLLGNASVNTIPRQRIHAKIEQFLGPYIWGPVCISLSFVGYNSVQTSPREQRNNYWRRSFLPGPWHVKAK